MVLGNVAILVGSGILGSVLISGDAKIPSAGEVLSGAAKFVKKHGKEGKDASPNNDVHTAQLLSQVNHLRQEIQYLGSRPVTVVTNAAKSGTGKFTITAVVVAGVIGYVYIKWKGWKLSDMMFVTKRGLSDACNVVGSQLDRVSDDVTSARRHLAGRIDRVDISLDETQEIIEGTRDEVAVIHGDLSTFQEDLQSVNLVVRTLESKLVNLEYTQDRTAIGIGDLVEFTHKMERAQRANARQVQASTPPAIGPSSERIVRRTTSLPQAPARLPQPMVSSTEETSPREDSSQEQAPSRRALPTVSSAAETSPRVDSSQKQAPSRWALLTVSPAAETSPRVDSSQEQAPARRALPTVSSAAEMARRVDSSQEQVPARRALPTVSSAAETAPRVDSSQEQQHTWEASSSSAKANTSSNNTSNRFGGLRLLGFLRSSAS